MGLRYFLKILNYYYVVYLRLSMQVTTPIIYLILRDNINYYEKFCALLPEFQKINYLYQFPP